MKKAALATLLVTALSVGAAYAAAVAPPSPQGDAEARNPSAAGGAGVTVGPPAGASATFTLLAADASKLKDWIMQQKTASVAAPSGFTVAVGSTVPMNITLTAIPASVGVTAAVANNQYAVIDNKIVLVNPTDRKIVFVLA
jgi:hypothetical protein